MYETPKTTIIQSRLKAFCSIGHTHLYCMNVGKVSSDIAAAKNGKVGSNFAAAKSGQVSSNSKKR